MAIISNIPMFQHVLFYVLSNDLVASKKLLITAQNARFQIVFPGDYGATSIGNTNQMPTWNILLIHIYKMTKLI